MVINLLEDIVSQEHILLANRSISSTSHGNARSARTLGRARGFGTRMTYEEEEGNGTKNRVFEESVLCVVGRCVGKHIRVCVSLRR